MRNIFKLDINPTKTMREIRWGIPKFSRFFKRNLPITVGIIVISLVIAGAALAFTLGNIDGTWGTIDTDGATCNTWATGPSNTPTNYSTTDSAIQTPPDTDENQIRYGEPADYSCPGGNNWQEEFAHQSGFGFDGNDAPGSPPSDTPFYLGKFTHYNNPIHAPNNSFEYVDLTVNVPVTCKDGVTTTNFSFTPHFVLDETPNSEPCDYPGSSVCPDKVTVTQPDTETFTCDEGDYTVNILGFTTEGLNGENCDQSFNSSAVATEFITEESSDNAACLWAEITPPTADITPDKTCADFRIANPYYHIVTTNLGPGSARGVQIVDDLPIGIALTADPWYSSQLTTSSGTVDQGSCSVSGQTITCQLLTALPSTSADAAAKWTVDINVVYESAVFPISNTVTSSMATDDTDETNNTDTCQSSDPSTTSTTISSFKLSVGDALPPSSDKPEGPLARAITIDWITAIEENTLGFNIYRSATTESGMEKINTERINSKVFGTTSGASYHFVDRTAKPGTTYSYYLAEVSTLGNENIVSQETIFSGNFYLPILIK